jgi:hypothetical protein
MVLMTTGGDPFLTRPGLSAPGTAEDVLVIRMSVTGGEVGSVFWGTVDSPGYSPQREIAFSVVPDGEMHEVRVPVGEDPAWAGHTITSLRVDPTGGEGGIEIRIDSITVER